MKEQMLRALLATLVLAFVAGRTSATESLLQKAGGSGASLIGDHKARAIGDIVTIVIVEKSEASKETSTDRKKTTSTNSSIDSIFFPSSHLVTHEGEKPLWKWSSQSDFSGGGKTDTKQDLEARLTARVIDVMPNGNLLIEGTRSVEVAGTTQNIILTGIIRPQDIASDNTVESTFIADAKIRYEGTGDLDDSQRRGLLTRLWDWLNIF